MEMACGYPHATFIVRTVLGGHSGALGSHSCAWKPLWCLEATHPRASLFCSGPESANGVVTQYGVATFRPIYDLGYTQVNDKTCQRE